jgi:hypothetical protein
MKAATCHRKRFSLREAAAIVRDPPFCFKVPVAGRCRIGNEFSVHHERTTRLLLLILFPFIERSTTKARGATALRGVGVSFLPDLRSSDINNVAMTQTNTVSVTYR